MKKIITFFILLCASSSYPAQFDELDKAPEGAHKGQMLAGAFVSIGLAAGNTIDEENKFLNGSTYTFSGGETTKKLLVTHLAFNAGAFFEYMPLDHIGVRTKIKTGYIIQRTTFGADYQNWSGTLYSDYSMFVGPSFHLTNRKQWDIVLIPVIGYSIGKFQPTPVASQILISYTGPSSVSVSGMSYGTELNFTAYFTGGLAISLGLDWSMYTFNFSSFNLTNSQTSATYSGATSGVIHTLSLVISAGYAFSN